MSISSSTSKVRASGNGVTTAFPFPFRIFLDTDIEVYVIEADGTELIKTISTDYTVVLDSNVEGGTVNMIVAPITGEDLLIRRQIDATQPSIFNKESNFPEVTIENAFDRAVMQIQQLEESVGRAILQPIGSTLTVTFPAPDNGKIVRWLGAAGVMENVDVPSVNIAGDTLTGSVNITDNLEIGALQGAGDAALRMNDTDKSVLLNRLTTAQEAALNAEDGMLHWNTTINQYRGHRDSAFFSIGDNPFAHKNKIINGRFESWLEGDISATVSDFFFADLFRRSSTNGGGTSATVAASQQEHTLGQTVVANNPKNFAKLTYSAAGSPTGNTHIEEFGQPIPGVNKFSGKTVTFSVWIKSDITSQEIFPYIIQNFGTGGSPSAVVNTGASSRFALTTGWTLHTFTIAVPSITGKTLGTAGDDFTKVAFSVRHGSTTATAIGDTSGALSLQATGDIDVSDPQKEISLSATSFDLRHQSVDDMMIARRVQPVDSKRNESSLIRRGGGQMRLTGNIPLTSMMDGSPVAALTIASVSLTQDAVDGTAETGSDQANWSFLDSDVVSNSLIEILLERATTEASRGSGSFDLIGFVSSRIGI